ncbi:hypothetical protein R1T43_07975 [Alteromonas sp. CI.11.F.A3]|uniref:hypothetical protein n=1 Tax=Alteromonas sp. CI.11.F.A3 TaxID=3079555 RepID=UPI00294249D1|nr:hypothetical protein [Alteromonas sp. CI.11.F.A3]WOI38947.1 hypothetical protein R1T43_07975 [Alteromonas sp. CI.11.F.A3]
MSNDLIFSILPRNTKVPIETDNRVKKVARSEKSEALNHDEKEQHDEVHIVDEMEQRERHEQNNEKNEHPSEQESRQQGDRQQESLQQEDSQANTQELKQKNKQDDKSIGQQLGETESRELNTADATGTKLPRGIKHVDITI